MRNRAAIILLLLFLVIIYALSQNGTLVLPNLFNGTPNGTLFFSVTARPLFPTAASGPVLFSTVPPYYPTQAPVYYGATFPAGGSAATNGQFAGQAGCVVPNGWVLYTIQNGDTIGTIATAYGVALDQFVAANCLANPDLVYVGQVVYVPAR